MAPGLLSLGVPCGGKVLTWIGKGVGDLISKASPYLKYGTPHGKSEITSQNVANDMLSDIKKFLDSGSVKREDRQCLQTFARKLQKEIGHKYDGDHKLESLSEFIAKESQYKQGQAALKIFFNQALGYGRRETDNNRHKMMANYSIHAAQKLLGLNCEPKEMHIQEKQRAYDTAKTQLERAKKAHHEAHKIWAPKDAKIKRETTKALKQAREIRNEKKEAYKTAKDDKKNIFFERQIEAQKCMRFLAIYQQRWAGQSIPPQMPDEKPKTTWRLGGIGRGLGQHDGFRIEILPGFRRISIGGKHKLVWTRPHLDNPDRTFQQRESVRHHGPVRFMKLTEKTGRNAPKWQCKKEENQGKSHYPTVLQNGLFAAQRVTRASLDKLRNELNNAPSAAA